MKRLEQLPEIANQAMGGLTAGQNLKLRIEKAAMNPDARPVRRHAAWIPAVSCMLVVTVGLAIALPALQGGDGGNGLISTQPAGQSTVSNERARLDLEDDNVSISRSNEVPSYRTLWESGSNGNFPLIGVKGQYYRLMSSPSAVDSNLLGSSLGAVEEFTTEPSLSGTDTLLSNTVSQGADVYEISGMGGTLVAAEVDGTCRLFQRVSFNGGAVRGNEGLGDTLQIAGHITAMELSDVGTITDADVCEALFATLLDNALYESSASVSGSQSLLFSLDNGLTVQLIIKNDRLSACGTWSCPEFFEEFEAAVE